MELPIDKKQIIKAIDELPEDTTIEQAIEQLMSLRKIQTGPEEPRGNTHEGKKQGQTVTIPHILKARSNQKVEVFTISFYPVEMELIRAVANSSGASYREVIITGLEKLLIGKEKQVQQALNEWRQSQQKQSKSLLS